MELDLKAKLLGATLPQEPLELEGIGTVTVRALSRKEVMMLQAHDIPTRERKMIVLGLVDPALTEAEAGQWIESGASGPIEKVTVRIAQLSGLQVKYDKGVYEEMEDNPAAEFRPLPVGEAGDAGGTDAAGTQ